MIPRVGKKIFHVCMIAIIIIAILTISAIIFLRYQVVGETNLPFELSKIIIVSSVSGTNNQDDANKWNIGINQNNDIYLYIQKNSKFSKTQIIDNIVIENFSIEKNDSNISGKIYKPSDTSVDVFDNSDENISNKITYKGDLQSDLKNLKISNQGGIACFRYSSNNVASYISNEAQEINYNDLLKLCNVSLDSLKAKITFDLIIRLTDGKEYKSTINVEVPTGNVIEEGRTSLEITDVTKFIFKRVEK